MDKVIPLTENYEFRRVYAKGKSAVRPTVVVYALRRPGKAVRVGITATKKIGSAVERNRARRLLRESVRTLWPRLRFGYDFVLVSRGKTAHVKCGAVLAEMADAMRALSVLREEAEK